MPVARIDPPRPRARRNQYQLGVAELLSAAVSNTAQQVVKLVKTLPAMGRAAACALQPTIPWPRTWPSWMSQSAQPPSP